MERESTDENCCPRPDLSHFDERKPWQQTVVVAWEEPGTFWLWAWPKLLWASPRITWLFSPVTGKYPWPGDLWGVNASGQLVLVETKRTGGAQDPFEDFVPFQKKFNCGKWEHSVDDIIARWRKDLKR